MGDDVVKGCEGSKREGLLHEVFSHCGTASAILLAERWSCSCSKIGRYFNREHTTAGSFE